MIETAEDRICANCAHLVGKRHSLETAETWRCHAKENVMSISKCLITGRQLYHLRFQSCYEARSSVEEEAGCGSSGRWFVEYHAPMHGYASEVEAYRTPRVVGGRKHTADALLAELDAIPPKE